MLMLPIFVSISGSSKVAETVPFGTVAIAGHTVLGNWCECGTRGCIADPGETCGGRAVPAPGDNKFQKGNNQSEASPRTGLDLGSGVLLLVLSLFVMSRLRA